MDDAWKQHHDLVAEYTKEWTPREDLKVEALGVERTVRLSIGRRLPPGEGKFRMPSFPEYTWTATQRNLSTMRELAEAILAACDFVEAANPKWARHGHAFREAKIESPNVDQPD